MQPPLALANKSRAGCLQKRAQLGRVSGFTAIFPLPVHDGPRTRTWSSSPGGFQLRPSNCRLHS